MQEYPVRWIFLLLPSKFYYLLKAILLPPTFLLFMFSALILLDSCHTSNKISKYSKDALLDKYSKQLQSTVTNKKLYLFVDRWIGKPYRYGGKDERGIDCSNFVFLCFREVYRPIPYASAHQLVEKIQRKSKDHLQEGDLVFFSFGDKKVSHVGIYLINHFFIHASTQKGVIISSLQEMTYQKAYFCGGAYKF